LVDYNKKKAKGSRLHSISQRSNTVNINNLSPDQLVSLSASIGKSVNAILVEAEKKAQAILDVYGMKLKLQYSLEQKESLESPKIDETTVNTAEDQ